MPWFHWLAGFMVFGGTLFHVAFPGKPWIVLIPNIAIIVVGFLIAAYVPPDIFEQIKKRITKERG